MDAKLAAYRTKKKREQFIKTTKEKFYSIFNGKKLKNDMEGEDIKLKDEGIEIDNDQSSACSDGENESVDENELCDELTFSKISLYLSLWLILFSFAVYLEFGAVYFAVSVLYIIWANTRTGPKKRGEVSAYSVFNPDCEAIDGTLKPEQFENELRLGILR